MSKPVYKWLLIGGGIAVTVILLLAAAFRAYSWNLLKLAVESKNLTATRLLLLLGADPNENAFRSGQCRLLSFAMYPSNTYKIDMALLKAGAKVEESMAYYLFCGAADAPSEEMLQDLLDAGLKPEDGGLTMLEIYSCRGDLGKMMAALDAGADPNHIIPLGHSFGSTLDMAIFSRKPNAVKFLLDAGADPNLAPSGIHPPLVLAIKICPSVVDDLLKAGADPKVGNGDALTVAIAWNRNDVLKKLLAAGVPAGIHRELMPPPLFTAAKCGNTKAIEILLAAGANLDETARISNAAKDYSYRSDAELAHMGSNNYTVISYAFSDSTNLGTIEVIKLLARHGAGAPDLRNHIMNDNANLLIPILEFGVNPDLKVDPTHSAVELACELDRDECLLALLKAGAKVPELKTVNNAALCAACWNGDAAKVEAALKAGLNPNGSGRVPPLAFASVGGNPAAIPLLIAAKADPEKAGADGLTPLWLAIENNKMDTAAALVKAGANVNARIGDGDTPLCRASRDGRRDRVKFLIDAGADVNAPGKNDCLPLYLAEKPEIREILKAAGAREE